tara:strand:+ start:393 stop:563 length:171 start_codon:yes stop_codon:yes gene_type:complete
MHLEVAIFSVRASPGLVSILVSNWMHLEELIAAATSQTPDVSILVSNWMHLEVPYL